MLHNNVSKFSKKYFSYSEFLSCFPVKISKHSKIKNELNDFVFKIVSLFYEEEKNLLVG